MGRANKMWQKQMSYITKVLELGRQWPEAVERFELTQEYEEEIVWHEQGIARHKHEIAECKDTLKLIKIGKYPKLETKQPQEEYPF